MAATYPFYAPTPTLDVTGTPKPKDIWSVPSVNTAMTPAAAAANSPPDFFGSTPQAEELYKPIRIPRIPGANPYIATGFDDAARLRANLSGYLDRYRTALAAGSKPIADFTQADVEQLGNLYNGGYAQSLAAVRARRAAAMGNLNNVMFADLRRSLGLGAAGGGGAAGAGLGSYLVSRAAQEGGRLRASEAYDRAEQERNDVNAVLAAQMAQLGRRQQLLSALPERELLPAQYEGTFNTAYQQAVNAALQQAMANMQISTAVDAG